jgi:hypothetical protein
VEDVELRDGVQHLRSQPAHVEAGHDKQARKKFMDAKPVEEKKMGLQLLQRLPS